MAEKQTTKHPGRDSYKTLSERGWFRDRRELIETYFSSLNSTRSNSLQLLIYYGLGGQGKTALCEEILRRTRDNKDKDLIIGHIDLHERDQLTGEGALLWLRNALAQNAKLTFPAFDLGFTMYWKATRPERPLPYFIHHGWLSSASEFGEEAGIEFIDDILSDLAEAVSQGVIASLPLATVARKLLGVGRKQYVRYTLVRDNPDVRDLVESEKGKLSTANLYDRLPILLANDLRRSVELNDRSRLVLLIDEYEKVFEEGGASASLISNPFDDAVRTLISRLDKTLVVIFSRERLPWAKHPPRGENADAWSKWIDDSHYPVDGLVKEDARNLLRDASIEDEALIAAIIDGAQIMGDSADSPIHPLMLELQIYHYEAISSTGRRPAAEDFRTEEASHDSLRGRLMERFIRDYRPQTQTLIRVLAVPRFFNRDVFGALRALLPGGGPLEQFKVISTLAFVQKRAKNRLTFPKAIREALLLLPNDEVKREAREVLWQFYRRRTDEATLGSGESVEASLEAMHHGLSVDTSEALGWWRDLANKYLEAGRLALSTPIEEQVIQGLEPLQPAYRPELAEALARLSSSYGALGRPQAAIRTQSRSLALLRQIISPGSPALIEPILILANLYRSEDKFLDSEILTDEALDVVERHSKGSPSLEKASALAIASQGLEERGGFVQAEPMRRSVVEITRTVLPRESPFYFQALADLMSNLILQNQFNEAKSVAAELIEVAEQDDDRPAAALILFAKGAAFWANTSEQLFMKEFAERGVSLFEARYGLTADGNQGAEFTQARVALALLFKYVDRNEDAIRLGEMALDVLRSDRRLATPALAEALVSFAILSGLVGETKKGQSALTEAQALIAQISEAPHDLHLLVAQAQSLLASLESRDAESVTDSPQDEGIRVQADVALPLEGTDPSQRLQMMRASLMRIESRFGRFSRQACMDRIEWAGVFLTYGQLSDAISTLRETITIIDEQSVDGSDWSQEKLAATFVLCSALMANGEFEELGNKIEWLEQHLPAEAIANSPIIPLARLQIAEHRLVKALPQDAPKEFETYISLLKNIGQHLPYVDRLVDSLVILDRDARGEDVGLAEIEGLLANVEHTPIHLFVRLRVKELASKKNANAGNYDRAIHLKEQIVNAWFVMKSGLDLATRHSLIELADLCKQAGHRGEAHKWRKKALRNLMVESTEDADFLARESPKLASEFIQQRSPKAAQILMEQVLATPTALLPEKSPARWELRRQLVRALVDLKEFAAAQRIVEDLSRDISDSDSVHAAWKIVVENIAAEVEIEKGDQVQALVHVNNALALVPTLSPEFGWSRSETLLNSLRVSVISDPHSVTPLKTEEIIDGFKDLQKEPFFVHLLTEIALIELQANQPEGACAHLERAVTLSAMNWGIDSPSHLYLQDLLANVRDNPQDPNMAAQKRRFERLQKATKHLRPISPGQWPLPTSLRDDWAYLDRSQSIELIDAVITTQQENGQVILPERFKVLAARRLPLPFYYQTSLIEVLVEDTGGNVGHFGLTQHEDRLTLLSGPSSQIFNLNLSIHVPAGSDQNLQISYLRFFCSWILADEGAFLLAERIEDAPPILPGKEDEARELAKNFGSISVSDRFGDEKKGTMFSAAVIYGGVPYRTLFQIQLNNAVKMLEDEPLAEEPLFMSWRSRNGARFLAKGESSRN